MRTSDSFVQLAMAMAKAQGQFPVIPREKTVEVKTRNRQTGQISGSYTYKYAPLETILEKVRKPLADNGLCVIQSIVTDESGTELLRSTLLHESGEWISADVPIFEGAGDNKSQAYASGVTYARRYGVQLLLCVAADEDDDGNGGAQGSDAPDYVRVPPRNQQQKPQSPAQRARSGPERGGRIVDARQPGEEDQAAELPPYGDADFKANLPRWHEMIRSGQRTADDLVATLQSRAKFTPAQIKKIKTLPEATEEAAE